MCVAAACVAGTPIVAFDTTAISVGYNDDGRVVLRHLGKGGAVTIVGAVADPPDVYGLPDAPKWPIQISAGQTLALRVRLITWPEGSYQGTLTVKGEGCSDADLQLPINSPYLYKYKEAPGCGGEGGPASLATLAFLALARRCGYRRRAPGSARRHSATVRPRA
jgi:hypothetical protein